MEAIALMCKAGKHPAQCGFQCHSCYSYDRVLIHICDRCKHELYEEEYKFDGSPELCSDCRKGENHEI